MPKTASSRSAAAWLWGDYDNDGLVDIFACGIESSSTLFRNLGNWKFRDETLAAGLPKNFTNAVFTDINGDGQSDLLVSTVREGVRCFPAANSSKLRTNAALKIKRAIPINVG